MFKSLSQNPGQAGQAAMVSNHGRLTWLTMVVWLTTRLLRRKSRSSRVRRTEQHDRQLADSFKNRLLHTP